MGHCILKVKFNKEDRILDDTAPVLFRNTQWILNTILKKSFYAILGYSKLMDHNDLVSLNNKRSSVVQESTNAASQTISSAKFSIVF
jgi:hypothetical protein